MALLHHATLTPTKAELLSAWLPGRPWAAGAEVPPVAAYRLDDPEGEVGIEGMLLSAGADRVLHVPLTYRAAPLAGAEEFLVGTSDHSVLGRRWVYDACGDPVFAGVLADTVLGGGTEAEQYFEVDGVREVRASSTTLRGSGSGSGRTMARGGVSAEDRGEVTVVRSGELEIAVARAVGAALPPGETLTARWDGGGPAVLATVPRGAAGA
jgi:hypothetical protein